MKLLAKNGNFTLLWLGQLISQLGDRFYQLAIFWWILDTGGSVGTMGGVMAVSALPSILLAPVSGTLVDRMSRKAIMVWTDAIRGLILLGISYLAWQEALQIWHLYGGSLLLAVLGALFNPAVLSAIPVIVEEEDMQEAMALHSLTANLSTFIGPAIGGIVIAAYGVPAALLADAVSFFLSSISETFISIKEFHGEHEEFWASITGGLRWVRSQRALFRLLLSFGLLNYFLIPVTIIVPAMARIELSGGAGTAGFLEGCVGGGSLAAAVLLTYWKLKSSPKTQLVWSVAALGLSLLALSLASTVGPAAGSLLIFGFHLGLLNISLIVMFQRMVPAELKGRFFALLDALSFGLFPLAYASMGPAEMLLGIRGILVAGGTVAVLISAYYGFFLPSFGEDERESGEHITVD